MSEQIVTTGFEKFFIKSWMGWDILDTASFVFTGCEIVPVEGLDSTRQYDVSILLDSLDIEYYDVETKEVMLTKKIVLAFE